MSVMTEDEVHGVKLDYSYQITPEKISARTNELIEDSRVAYNKVAMIKDENVNFNTVIKAVANIHLDYDTLSHFMRLTKKVCPDKALRDAATEALCKLENFGVEIRMRKDLLDKIMYFEKNNTEELDPESKRFVERLIKVGKRSGLHLSQELKDRLKAIQTTINELCICFCQNLNEVTTFLEFDEQSLVGLSESFINNLEKTESGKRKVTLKYPHYFPILRKAHNPKTRQLLEKEFNSQCIEENTKILEELVELRQKQSDILGYPTHSAFNTEMVLAKTAENVKNFLTGLAEKSKDLWMEEKELLLQYKKEQCEKHGYEYDGKLNSWDTSYCMNLVKEHKYAVDQEKVREYFPLPVVTKGLMEIYQELLDLKFAEVTNPKVWHVDVKMFSVRDASTNEVLGYFFLDLFPREGKFGHACIQCLQYSCLDQNSSRQLAVVAMIANFTKPTEHKPSLLDHLEVRTYFHEFGHVMHFICARATYSIFGGTNVEIDFKEAPSQMLENWIWEKEALLRMSAHYMNNSPLPDEILDKLVGARNAFTGYEILRQVSLSMFDQIIHTSAKVDTRAIFKELSQEYVQILPQEGTNFAAHFLHLAYNYDALYYGYLWSEVFSMDMFATRFKKEGIMNKDTGKDYRRCILTPGGSKDGMEMLKEFLGREPNQNAYLESKGLKV